MWDIGLLGFGEAGEAFATGLQPSARRIASYDLKLDAQGKGGDCATRMAAARVTPVALADLAQAPLILCLVTADQALMAARTAAPLLRAGGFWFDGNSCSPGSKKQSATVIETAGGHYVDLALMAPVYPGRHRTPMLASGPAAAEGVALLAGLGMTATPVGPLVGQASSIKMLRSVIIKGLEALTAESFLAARAAGVEDAVIASLQASDPGINWAKRGAYNLERMLVHGARRAAEMQEVAATLRELGLPDRMARATVDWQAELASLALSPGPDDLAARTDMILRTRG